MATKPQQNRFFGKNYIFFRSLHPENGGGSPYPTSFQKTPKTLKLGLFLVSNSTKKYHKYEQNARIKDTYPHGNAR